MEVMTALGKCMYLDPIAIDNPRATSSEIPVAHLQSLPCENEICGLLILNCHPRPSLVSAFPNYFPLDRRLYNVRQVMCLSVSIQEEGSGLYPKVNMRHLSHKVKLFSTLL